METPTTGAVQIRSEESQLLLRINEQDDDKDTLELRLGLPGSNNSEDINNIKRPYSQTTITSEDPTPSSSSSSSSSSSHDAPPPPKAQVMGWPPIRSYRRNHLQASSTAAAAAKKKTDESVMYVKVSMDGAPYLRKIDLKGYNGYQQLLNALEELFQFSAAGGKLGGGGGRYIDGSSEFAPTYEDKDGDWMLLGDVPWEMFVGTCKRLRIMKGTEARGLGCTTTGGGLK